MNTQLYPLKFEPIYQYRLWGGRRLEHWLSKPLPPDDPIGEAWLLSDREDMANKVTDGAFKDATIKDLMKNYKYEILGMHGNDFEVFPLLLKFLDCNEVLSVQVHPSDDQKEYLPPGESGKTEAWVVLEADADGKIYAGLKPGTTKENLKQSIDDNSVAERLHSFTPQKDDAVYIQSGTVHTLNGAVVFEVQENSDVTYRLYDWDRTDAKTGKPRELQVDKALACIDFDQVDVGPVTPTKSERVEHSESVFDNEHFMLWRIETDVAMKVGFNDEPVILVCLEGNGSLKFKDEDYDLGKGEVMLLPAIIGQLDLYPEDKMTVLQIAIPNKNKNNK